MEIRRNLRHAGIMVGLLLAAFVAYAGWQNVSMARHGGGGLFRLVGIADKTGGPIYDAHGRKTGRTLYYSGGVRTVGGRPIGGYFVFEAPSFPPDVTMCDQLSVAPRGSQEDFGGPLSEDRVFSKGGGKMLYADFDLPTAFLYTVVPGFAPLKRLAWSRSLTSVDMKLRYWRGARGEAEITFAGPFAYGKTIRTEGRRGACSITPWFYASNADDWGTELILESTGIHDDWRYILAYDMEGKRHPAGCSWSQARGRQTVAAIAVEDMRPQDILFLTIGELPREEVFRDVPIVYPGGPALKTTGMVLPPPEPSQAEKLAADDPRVRCSAVISGLKARNATCVGPAFELLSDDDAYLRRRTAQALSGYAKSLSAGDIRRIGRSLSSKDDPRVEALLAECLLSSDLTEATEELKPLAADDRTWLWWHAMGSAGATQGGSEETIPRAERVRNVIRKGFSGSESDQEMVKEARALLPTLVTRELAEADPEIIGKILAMIAEQCDRKTATEAMIAFLKATDGLSGDDAERNVDSVAGYLNEWYHLGLSRMAGQEGGLLWQPAGRLWREVADDVLVWHESGSVPAEVPEGYKAEKDDVRVVFKGARMSNETIVRLCPAQCSVKGRSRTISLCPSDVKDRVDFRLIPCADAAGRWYATMTFVSPNGGWSRGTQLFDLNSDREDNSLFNLIGDSGCVYVERATDPKSIVAGTKAFREYWEKYVGTPLIQSTDAAVDK